MAALSGAVRPWCLPIALLLLVTAQYTQANADTYPVGVGRADVTPKYPVRLSGFGFRRDESEGVQQRIYAKALAFGDADPAVLLAVDNLGISADLVGQLAKRLARHGVKPDRLAVTATHTHTAPMLTGVCPTLFGIPIPKEHQEHIDRYTREFLDGLEKAAVAALADRKPAKLSWGVGSAGFAINRRTKGGPTDHDLPLLVVRDPNGKIRALWVSYACHCVTLSHNKVGGDWAGFAQQILEDEHPDAVALVSIGCGADQNPSSGVTKGDVEMASRQGLAIALAVQRMLHGYLAPVAGELIIDSRKLELPLAPLPSKEEWEKRANRKDAVGHHARVQLERLARGEKLKSKIDYVVRTWAFGDSLALAFLPGEVVVDYGLRLKRELDGRRLWLNAYSNDAPCYIPSERVLKEGGYEGGGAMVYYDVPGPFQPGLEEKIIGAVKEQLSGRFAAPFDARRTAGSRPLSPQQSWMMLRSKPDLRVDLVAGEPLVSSPVAIAFGPDGRLWVAEMYDYPEGLKGDYKPAGRVRVLEDTDGDGLMDKATVFLDNIPFPTGITVWRNGVLICAAPDILYAEDADGKGKATKVEKLYSGFGTHNYQARVNSLEYGLDGWVYGSCGIFGGKITCHKTGKVVDLGDRDFRIKPDTGELEAAVGRTQQGRVRDDRGNWFGCDNTTLATHLVLPDHYLRRNPHVVFPRTTNYVPDYADTTRLFPIRPPQMFQLSGPPNRVTGACGIGVYRDVIMGPHYAGDVYVCEPVNHVVHRLKLTPKGSTFSGRRAPDEKESEFLASADGWFRPVQVRTGTDGGLWVVDMYRYVIEHPRWIPTDDLERIDVRAGARLGRIYRLSYQDTSLRALPRLDKLSTAELVERLDTNNGALRDLAGQMLLWRGDVSAAPALEKLASGERPLARLQALCVLDGLGKLTPALVRKALADSDAGVRRHAVRLTEKHLEVAEMLPKLVADPDAQVRLQLALTLGNWRDPRAGKALAELAAQHAEDGFLVSAVLSGVNAANVADVLTGVLDRKSPPTGLVQKLVGVAAAVGDQATLTQALRPVTAMREGKYAMWQFTALANVLDALERRKAATSGDLEKPVAALIQHAREVAADGGAPEASRRAALSLLGRQSSDIELLGKLTGPANPPGVQSAALAALTRVSADGVAETLLGGWKSFTPALRDQALDVLMGRPAWRDRLLAALEKREVLPAHLDATRRQRLVEHRDAKVRERAKKIFTDLTSPDRANVIKEYMYAPLVLKGDSAKGKQVFARVCSTCHRLEGVGHSVGPELWALVNKSPAALMQEILDPNRNLDSRYVQYLAVTTRGQTFAGLLRTETATSITLLMQDGKTQTLLRTDLEELASTGKSLMPEGLEKELSKQDMADLLAYLGQQVKPSKFFAGNRPETITAKNGAYALPASACEIHGGDICFEEPFRNVGCWHGQDDHVVWALDVAKPGTFDVWLDYSCSDAVAGNAFMIQGGKAPLGGKVAGTGGWDRYAQKKIGEVALDAGKQKLVMRPVGAIRGALLDLRTLYLVPAGTRPPFARDEKAADPRSLAKQLLDDKLPAAQRQALIAEHPALAPELIAAMTADLKPEPKEEYRRIPWIWRVAVAAGRRNDAEVLQKMLDVSLPKAGEPLRDWQAVVIGGGVINGISLSGGWPAPRVKELLKDHSDLRRRWNQALAQAAAMADEAKVPTGTRYDALRMIALAGWEKRGGQLTRYLAKGTHDELMQGAISGLSDVDAPQVAKALIGGLGYYSKENRKFAVEALLRTDARAAALLDALEAGTVKKDVLAKEHVEALRQHKDAKLRERARKVLGE
jgi:putative membrane-bound dehydrogenase-like protein